jgi:hypothetical protein
MVDPKLRSGVPREQVEVLKCDRCGAAAKAYCVHFDEDDKMREFILCDKHNGFLEKLRGLDYGTWIEPKKPRKRGIQKVNLADVPKKQS